MLNFENLNILDKHIKYLKKKVKNDNIFLVGGSIRDILLGISNNPNDIDFTMAGDPKKIYDQIDKKDISHFMTEKFGTITLIKNSDSGGLYEILSGGMDGLIKYELTPLRTESGYADTRHPDKITRSNDIILDAARRDFTINCIYYFSTEYKFNTPSSKKIEEKKDILEELKESGIDFIPGLNILILQKNDYIKKLFKNGIFQKDFLDNIMNNLKTTIQSRSKNINISSNMIRIIIDPYKGIQDLINKKLQTCGDPDKRFQEDALRLIRGIRFVNVLNQKIQNNNNSKDKITLFDFEKETWISLKNNSKLIKKIAKERIKEELIKSFKYGNPFGFTALLDESGILKYLFPSLAKTKKIEQPIRYHPFDVYAHTMLTLYQLQKINSDPLVRFAMLYHDVGKPLQFAEYKNGLSKDEIREIMAGPNNHRRSGPQLAKKDFSNLGFSNREINEICDYIARHHKPEEILNASDDNREKRIRKFLSDAGFEKVNNVLDIAIADRLGQYNPLQNSSDISDVRELKENLKKLHDKEGQFTVKNLAIDGNDIIKYFKIKAGPIIGDLIQRSLNRVMDDIKSRNKKEKIFEFLKKYMKSKAI